MIGIFFWTAWFLLAGTAYAHAGPLAGLIPLLTSTAIGKVVLNIALKIGMSLLQAAMTETDEPEQPGLRTTIDVGGVKSMSFIVGTYATAGHLIYANTWGQVRTTSNAGLAQVIGISDIPVTSISNEVWMRGRKIVRDPGLGEQSDSHAWFGEDSFPFPEFTVGEHPGIYWLFAKYRPAGAEQADGRLRQVFSGDPERPWTDDMIGRGVAHVILSSEYNRDLFRDIPKAVWQVEGIALYDPRQDDTVGGSGPQRWGDPATYRFSDNNAVIIYNILRGIYYEGVLVFGGGIPASRLPLSNWFAAMNECDRLIDGERQFRGGYEIKPAEHSPLNVIDKLLAGCNGRMAEIGGVYKIRVGAPALPSYFFTDEAVVITENQSFDPFPGLEQTYNGVSATYPEPEAAWEMKDAPLRIDQDFVNADDGRELIAPVQFDTVPFAIQVQRLQSALMRDNRRFRRHRHTLPPEAFLLEPLDTVSWTSAHNGYVGKLFELTSMDDLENSNQAVSLKEVDPGDWGWNRPTDELPYTVGPMGPIEPQPQPIYDWSADPDVVPDNAGTARRPAILLGWYGQVQDVQGVEFEVRLALSGEVVYRGRTDQVAAGQLLISQGLLPAVDYQVRGRYLPFSSRPTLWSGWLAVRTRDIRFDVYADVDLGGINRFVNESSEWMRYNTREELERAIANATADIGDFDTQYSNIQRLRRDLTVTYQNAKASWEEEIEVATGPDSALARRQETLEAALAGYLDADAVASAFSAAYAIIDTNSDAIEINTADLTQVKAALNGYLDADALADAVSLLNAGIVANADGITANSNAITQVNAAVGEVSASGTFRVQAYASPGDAWVRGGLQFSADNGVSFEEANIFLDARTAGTPRSRIMLDAEQVVIGDLSSPATVYRPFVIANGKLYADELYVDYAKIENVNIGWAEIGDAVVNNLVIGSANIGDLVVGTSNLAFGAVTQVVVHDYATTDVNNGNAGDWITRYTFTVDNEGGFPLFWDVEVNMFVRFTGASGGWMQLGFRFVNTTSGEEVLFERVIVDTGGGKTENATRFLIEIPPGSGVNTYALKTARSWNSYAQPNEARVQPTLKAIYWKR